MKKIFLLNAIILLLIVMIFSVSISKNTEIDYWIVLSSPIFDFTKNPIIVLASPGKFKSTSF